MTRVALALALAACSSGDRQEAPATHQAPSASAPRGPDNLVLRISRTGGAPRVYAYPRLDTLVWSADAAPAPSRMLAFDDEAGTLVYVDTRGRPVRMDFRQGAAPVLSKAKLTGIASVDGSEVYAIDDKGSVVRFARGGAWSWKPPVAAHALFPQDDGSLLVLGERATGAVVWHLHPPGTKIVDSTELPKVDRTLRTQVGDRVYLGSGSQLTGLRTRTMQRTADVSFSDPIGLLAVTPSGDRVFVVTRDSRNIDIVDRYQEKVSGHVEVGRPVSELRMDPIGRYLLARPEGTDSAIVIALGTNRVVGTMGTSWRADLPFVAPDGGIALAQGADVIIADGETLKPTTRVRGGAADFWYPFRWTGFRPRDAKLDEPVQFARPAVDSAKLADSLARVAGDSSAPVKPAPAAAPRDTAPKRAARGYTVSFAALLVAKQAQDLAAQIHVGSETARVATAVRDGATIYRVVLGPYATREEAERIGRESKQQFWVYEGGP